MSLGSNKTAKKSAGPGPSTSATPTVRKARLVAHEVLLRVTCDGAYADRALNAALGRSGLDERDAGLATELVYGTLRHSVRLDFMLGQLATRSLRKVPPETLIALRLGAYQLLETRVADHSAVNEAVALVRRHAPHQAGFANALLRQLIRRRDAGNLPDPSHVIADPIEALAVSGSHPAWLVRRAVEELGLDETRAWVEANNKPAPVWLRVNTTRGSLERVRADLEASGATVRRHEYVPQALAVSGAGSPAGLPGFAAGLFTVQDPAAQLIGHLAAPAKGSVVLELCAAPGGKATHLAELVGSKGAVLAVEIHPGKARLVAENAKRMGLSWLRVADIDATNGEAVRAALRTVGRDTADVVVVDAPCTGFGTLRRNPELRQRDPQSIAELCALQDRLLATAALFVAPGGVLVYSVCTITQEEGPDRIASFLKQQPGFSLAAPPEPFLTKYEAPLNGGMVMRTWPHRHDMDGFFAARIQRA